MFCISVSCNTAKKDSLSQGLSREFAPRALPASALYTPEPPALLEDLLLARPRPGGDTAVYEQLWTDPASLELPELEAAAQNSIEEILEDIP